MVSKKYMKYGMLIVSMMMSLNLCAGVDDKEQRKESLRGVTQAAAMTFDRWFEQDPARSEALAHSLETAPERISELALQAGYGVADVAYRFAQLDPKVQAIIIATCGATYHYFKSQHDIAQAVKKHTDTVVTVNADEKKEHKKRMQQLTTQHASMKAVGTQANTLRTTTKQTFEALKNKLSNVHETEIIVLKGLHTKADLVAAKQSTLANTVAQLLDETDNKANGLYDAAQAQAAIIVGLAGRVDGFGRAIATRDAGLRTDHQKTMGMLQQLTGQISNTPKVLSVGPKMTTGGFASFVKSTRT